MQEFFHFYAQMEELFFDPKFQKDVRDADKGVQVAARRMRKSVLTIGKLAKAWRARSVELMKQAPKK